MAVLTPVPAGGFRTKAMFECMNASLASFRPAFVSSPEPDALGAVRQLLGLHWCFSSRCMFPDHASKEACPGRTREPKGLLSSPLARSFELKACLKTVQLTSNAFCFSFIIACHAMFSESLLIYYLFHFFPFSLFLHAVPPVSSLLPILCSCL